MSRTTINPLLFVFKYQLVSTTLCDRVAFCHVIIAVMASKAKPAQVKWILSLFTDKYGNGCVRMVQLHLSGSFLKPVCRVSTTVLHTSVFWNNYTVYLYFFLTFLPFLVFLWETRCFLYLFNCCLSSKIISLLNQFGYQAFNSCRINLQPN